MSAHRKRIRGKNRGQATLEFLLSALVLLTTIFAAVQLIVIVHTYGAMAKAAKQGVRYAIVHGANSSPVGSVTDIQNAVKRYANYPGMTINVTGAGGAPSTVVEVTLDYQFSMLSLGWATPRIRASARGRIFY
jgi:Flp pilus assembly protein TadG